jgi:hypothetical protein
VSDDSESLTDDRIREAVRERLARLQVLDVDSLSITVNDGEVTLQGTLVEFWRRQLAEDVVRAIPGVRAVHNQLQIVPDRVRREIVASMDVVNDLLQSLGSVAEVYGDSMIMNCASGPRVYVPFDSILGVADEFVVVNGDPCPLVPRS